jgi:hypothetical protein
MAIRNSAILSLRYAKRRAAVPQPEKVGIGGINPRNDINSHLNVSFLCRKYGALDDRAVAY